MKKILLAILSCLMLCCCCLFAGCGEAAGTYELDKIEMTTKYGGNVVYQLGEEWGGVTLQKDTIVVVLNEDGSGFLRVSELDEDEVDIDVDYFSWSYGYEDEIYAVVDEYVEYRAEKSGSKLKVYFSDDTVIYLKK